MLKKLIGLVVVLLVVVIVAFIALVMYADTLVKNAIEYGGTTATGQQTTVDSVSLSFLGGTMQMQNFAIANPSGFEGDTFITMGDSKVAVSLASLRDEVVVIPELRLDSLNVNLAANESMSTNMQVILDHLKQLSGPAADQPAPAQEGEPKRFIVKQLAIENVTVDVRGLPMVQVPQVKLPPIVLKDIGSENAKGVLLSELTGIVLQKIMQTVAENPQLANAALNSLKSQLANLDLGQIGNVDVGQVGQQVDQLLAGQGGDLGQNLGGVLGNVTGQNQQDASGGGDAADQINRGLGGLLGGDQPQSNE